MKISLQGVTKTFREADGPVLKDIDYTFKEGSFIALMGRSGSGKSTLLNIMSGVETPTSGSVYCDDVDLFDLSDRARSKLRSQKTATFFQDYNLLDFLTASENITLGKKISGNSSDSGSVDDALERVGLSGFGDKKPTELSGGQCQRVAIARALTGKPEVIFADEPTGALDDANSRLVVDLLRSVSESGVTIIMVTHDPYIAAAADTVVELKDGAIARTMDAPSAMEILQAFAEDSDLGTKG